MDKRSKRVREVAGGTESPAGVKATVGEETAGAIGARDVLTEILRKGAVKLLREAIEAEVGAWIDGHAHLVDEHGRREVVRNGLLPEREIVTGIGPIKVAQPRVHDRNPGARRRSGSASTRPGTPAT